MRREVCAWRSDGDDERKRTCSSPRARMTRVAPRAARAEGDLSAARLDLPRDAPADPTPRKREPLQCPNGAAECPLQQQLDELECKSPVPKPVCAMRLISLRGRPVNSIAVVRSRCRAA